MTTENVMPSRAKMLLRYAASLAVAQVLTTAEILIIAASLQLQSGTLTTSSTGRLITISALIVLSVALVAVGGVANLAPSSGWFLAGREPTQKERRWAMDLANRQSLILTGAWFLSGTAFIVLNLDTGAATLIIATMAMLFGATSTICLGLIVSRRSLRPVIAAAGKTTQADPDETSETTPGVLARLLLMWTLCSALPTLAIVALIFFRSRGWFMDKSLSMDTPVMVLSLVAVALGLRAMILVSRSISDPVRSVVEAMAEVEHGHINVTVDVYERSEIGRLQHGFNRMVEQLRERDRLRELFGRHVGPDVARRALEEDGTLHGDVREVAVLFIDLVDSTRLADSRPPQEVADVLNDFFRIVVAGVERHNGFVNKFQGDAALVVFGAPLRDDDAAASALAAARDLGAELHRLPIVDFGIGVSAGPVFAGNIGAENRYEYTVIGDAVNEAARLADQAKAVDGRVLCSDAVLNSAGDIERQHWTSHGSAVLRGRSAATHMSIPAPIR